MSYLHKHIIVFINLITDSGLSKPVGGRYSDEFVEALLPHKTGRMQYLRATCVSRYHCCIISTNCAVRVGYAAMRQSSRCCRSRMASCIAAQR